MTIAAAVAILSAVLAAYVAVLSWRFAAAPGWSDQRWFSAIALLVGTYCALSVPITVRSLEAWTVPFARLQLACVAGHLIAWFRYSTAHLGLPTRRWERGVVAGLVVFAFVAAATPWVHDGGTYLSTFEPLDLVYVHTTTTFFGDAAVIALILLHLVPAWRFARARLGGDTTSGGQAVALGFLVLMAAHDLLALHGIVRAPYLIDVAFIVPLAAVGYSFSSRFALDARDLALLRRELQAQVEQRTAELSHTRDELHRAEKLAALGELAAGIAHEVNNPAAVVSASLAYLDENEAPDLSDDGRGAVRDANVAMARINAIVRQLLDAGRLASSRQAPYPVHLHAVVEESLRVARARCGRRVLLVSTVPSGAYAHAHESLLVQVLSNLLVNAIQSVPEHSPNGQVVVRLEDAEDRARVVVEDNGEGMPADVLRRIFEPFFTTKPFGVGTGLGLAVSRGLVAGFGGELRLESEPGKGTRAIVELQRSAQPSVTAANLRTIAPVSALVPAGVALASAAPRPDAAPRAAPIRLLETT
jgi:signal transduction histidine kinase